MANLPARVKELERTRARHMNPREMNDAELLGVIGYSLERLPTDEDLERIAQEGSSYAKPK